MWPCCGERLEGSGAIRIYDLTISEKLHNKEVTTCKLLIILQEQVRSCNVSASKSRTVARVSGISYMN